MLWWGRGGGGGGGFIRDSLSNQSELRVQKSVLKNLFPLWQDLTSKQQKGNGSPALPSHFSQSSQALTQTLVPNMCLISICSIE